jgi:hypothetical protein
MQLKPETIRTLSNAQLTQAAGGVAVKPPRWEPESASVDLEGCCCSAMYCSDICP